MKNFIERLEKENNIDTNEFTLVGVCSLSIDGEEANYYIQITNDEYDDEKKIKEIDNYKLEKLYSGNGMLIMAYNEKQTMFFIYMKSENIYKESDEEALDAFNEDYDNNKLNGFLIEYDSIPSTLIQVNYLFQKDLIRTFYVTKALSDEKYYKEPAFLKYDSGYIVAFDSLSLLKDRLFIFFKED
jgi:hypothetical protein